QYSQIIFDLIIKNKDFLKETMVWVDKYKSVQDAINFIYFCNQQHELRKQAVYIIIYDFEVIGSLSFVNLDLEKQKGELGYWLSQEYNGQGIMSKCIQSFIEYGFKELKLNKIIIKCIEKNIKSSKLAEKLCFKFKKMQKEGFEINNIKHNVLKYELIKNQKQNI
ncbi:ribosomal protein-serine acetyltransferase, putative, partial [Ichthyophthirius multifiliis]